MNRHGNHHWKGTSAINCDSPTPRKNDINAIGKDGLTVAHTAAVFNNINALKLFEKLGANMVSLGEVGHTPAEMNMRIHQMPKSLLATKRAMAKAAFCKMCDTSVETFHKT